MGRGQKWTAKKRGIFFCQQLGTCPLSLHVRPTGLVLSETTSIQYSISIFKHLNISAFIFLQLILKKFVRPLLMLLLMMRGWRPLHPFRKWWPWFNLLMTSVTMEWGMNWVWTCFAMDHMWVLQQSYLTKLCVILCMEQELFCVIGFYSYLCCIIIPRNSESVQEYS